MNDPERLAGWLAVLMFVAGAFFAFLRLRSWYYRRGHPDPLEPRQDDGEEWPQLRFSLRRVK